MWLTSLNDPAGDNIPLVFRNAGLLLLLLVRFSLSFVPSPKTIVRFVTGRYFLISWYLSARLRPLVVYYTFYRRMSKHLVSLKIRASIQAVVFIERRYDKAI